MLVVIHDASSSIEGLECKHATHLEQIFCKLPMGLRDTMLGHIIQTCRYLFIMHPIRGRSATGERTWNKSYQLAKEISRTMLGGIHSTNTWACCYMCTLIDERTSNKFLHQLICLEAFTVQTYGQY